MGIPTVRPLGWRWCAALVITLVGAGCSMDSARSEPGRSVLVIAIDGLRGDHTGVGGYDRETTPNLDALAAEGISFLDAFSAAPWLLPAHVALLTSCDPMIARRILPEDVPASLLTQWNIPSEAPYLAREFQRSGYTTAAFVDHSWIAPLQGFATGFQHFVFNPSVQGVAGIEPLLQQWIRNRAAGENWFAYVQLHDLLRIWKQNDPQWDTFFPPREGLDRVPPVGDAPQIFFAVPRNKWSGGARTLGEYEAQYDGAIRRVDQELGHLVTRLQQSGVWETTTVVVVGSFGMDLGEGPLILDSGSYADVDLSVPLIVRPAQRLDLEVGRSVDALASTVDIGPTVLELEGLDIPGNMHGRSFAQVLRGQVDNARNYVYASCALAEGHAVVDHDWCFQSIRPGRARHGKLRLSWFGDHAGHPEEEFELLHDRSDPAGIGHLVHALDRDGRLAEMRAEAQRWAAIVQADREAWQGISSSRPAAAEPQEGVQ